MAALRLVSTELLLDRGSGERWNEVRDRVLGDLAAAIAAVRWPPGAPTFTIHKQSGKKRGQGSGVKPIKLAFVEKLNDLGWKLEFRAAWALSRPPGAFDAALDLSDYEQPPFVVEWETGNISSSHRAVNKMALGLTIGCLSGGILVLPTRQLAQYLTGRVGNLEELAAYRPLWRRLAVERGLLGLIAVEHDAANLDVPRIPKLTDGRALI
jgi:hypothetical protein